MSLSSLLFHKRTLYLASLKLQTVQIIQSGLTVPQGQQCKYMAQLACGVGHTTAMEGSDKALVHSTCHMTSVESNDIADGTFVTFHKCCGNKCAGVRQRMSEGSAHF